MNLKHCGIKINDIVTIDYVGSLESGKIVLSSKDEGVLTFKVGYFTQISGFNSAIIGMEIGDSKTCTFSPEETFGFIDKSLIYKTDLKHLPRDIVIGQRRFDCYRKIFLTILDINHIAAKVTVDANHTLAGKTLTFTLTVLDVIPSSSGTVRNTRKTMDSLKNNRSTALELN